MLKNKPWVWANLRMTMPANLVILGLNPTIPILATRSMNNNNMNHLRIKISLKIKVNRLKIKVNLDKNRPFGANTRTSCCTRHIYLMAGKMYLNLYYRFIIYNRAYLYIYSLFLFKLINIVGYNFCFDQRKNSFAMFIKMEKNLTI